MMSKHIFQENYEKIFGSIDEGWWEDMSDEAQAAYIKKHGEAPDANGGEVDPPKTDIFGNVPEDPDVDPYGDDDDDWETHGVGPSFWDSPTPGNEPDDELNQETLMIDGKQYRRISESVEKEEKPKYEFSEFYQRFKR